MDNKAQSVVGKYCLIGLPETRPLPETHANVIHARNVLAQLTKLDSSKNDAESRRIRITISLLNWKLNMSELIETVHVKRCAQILADSRTDLSLLDSNACASMVYKRAKAKYDHEIDSAKPQDWSYLKAGISPFLDQMRSRVTSDEEKKRAAIVVQKLELEKKSALAKPYDPALGFDRVLVIKWANNESYTPNAVIRSGHTVPTQFAVLGFKRTPIACESGVVSMDKEEDSQKEDSDSHKKEDSNMEKEKEPSHADALIASLQLQPLRPILDTPRERRAGWHLLALATGGHGYDEEPFQDRVSRGYYDSNPMNASELKQFIEYGARFMQSTQYVEKAHEIPVEILQLETECPICMGAYAVESDRKTCVKCLKSICLPCKTTAAQHKKQCPFCRTTDVSFSYPLVSLV